MRKYLSLLALLSPIFSFGLESKYLSYLEQIALPYGDHTKGEIEIVVDQAKIEEIESKQKEKLLKAGFSESEAIEFSASGIAYEDQYWLVLRDAVIFPSGSSGTYLRLIWKSAIPTGSAGVAILPILPDGKIALNLNYRHATRSWELELPRGLRKAGESDEQTALRELKEETGLQAEFAKPLGVMAADTGALGSVTPVYLVKATKKGLAEQEYSEAIEDLISLSLEELESALVRGYLIVDVKGTKKEIPLRDSHISFALLQAKLQKLL